MRFAMKNRASSKRSGRLRLRTWCAGSLKVTGRRKASRRTRRVETYAAVRLFIDTWRWAGVPFYIRAGKCLPVTATEVIVSFKRPPRETFEEQDRGLPNRLRLRLSPDVVIALGMRVKLPANEWRAKMSN